jgi:hypothetical protein
MEEKGGMLIYQENENQPQVSPVSSILEHTANDECLLKPIIG